jgi:hypothetical protein
MGYFAKLNENNAVIEVHSVSNFVFETDGIDDENKGIEFLTSIFNHSNWKRTSYNTIGGVYYDSITRQPSENQSKAFRKNYAGFNYIYDEQRDAFIPPKPYPSWVLDEFSCLWQPPIPRPQQGFKYKWNEENQQWELIS